MFGLITYVAWPNRSSSLIISVRGDYTTAKGIDRQAEYLVGSEWQVGPGPGPVLHPQPMLYQQGY